MAIEDVEVAATLRLELKAWENEHAAANGGKKPGREVVKNNAAIAAKYKEYHRLSQRQVIPVETPRKRNTILHERSANPASTTTPKRSNRSTASAKLLENGTAEDGPDQDPRPEIEATPAFIRCALGPTPQRDGQVLGIFDIFPSSTTPSKPTPTNTIPAQVTATPTKLAPPSSDLALSRTPQSSSKRFYLDAFTDTPLKRKRDDGDEQDEPSSTAKRQFATPSFLRRSFPLAPIADADPEPAPLPFKKRHGAGLVRTLSSMIQSLRRNEDQRMDDEWEMLNELEAEERGDATASNVQVDESQEMPLGPDAAAQPSDDDNDNGRRDRSALDANGNPRKVWKKKGLKRQTRRVIMRPVLHEAQKAGAELPAEDDEDVVAETQLQENLLDTSARELDGDGDEDEAEREDLDSTTAKKKNKKKPEGPVQGAKAADPAFKKDGKPARKVNALAHTNFRKLKIKNKNSKANGRKFGGRR